MKIGPRVTIGVVIASAVVVGLLLPEPDVATTHYNCSPQQLDRVNEEMRVCQANSSAREYCEQSAKARICEGRD